MMADDTAKYLTGTVPPNGVELALSRDQARSRRAREVRATTISMKRLTKREQRLQALLNPDTDHWRPATRGDCELVERPCPYVGCRYNLFLDVSPKTGAVKLNFPDLEPDQIPETCALDVADEGGLTLELVAEITNITRERVRQVEVKAFATLEKLNRRRRHLPLLPQPVDFIHVVPSLNGEDE